VRPAPGGQIVPSIVDATGAVAARGKGSDTAQKIVQRNGAIPHK
jgi:hypothetical protein